MTFLTRQPIQLAKLTDTVSEPDHGGVASFVGLVRNHQDGRTVERLDYSAYEPMAEAEAGRIVAEAELRWPVKIALLHRLGELSIGDVAVAVVAAGAHRGESFDACRYVIEEVKRRVPIWKKEYYGDGRVEWVGAGDSAIGRLGDSTTGDSAIRRLGDSREVSSGGDEGPSAPSGGPSLTNGSDLSRQIESPNRPIAR